MVYVLIFKREEINKKREKFINMNDSIVTKDKRNKKIFS